MNEHHGFSCQCETCEEKWQIYYAFIGKIQKNWNNMTKWEGFAFPMGFFVVVRDGKVAIGKRDPVTKEVIDWFLVSDKEDFKTSLNGFMKRN